MLVENRDMDLGKNIKEARKAAGLTQVQLAERMGITQKDISRWESNVRSPGAMSLKLLYETIGVSADKILELESEEKQ